MFTVNISIYVYTDIPAKDSLSLPGEWGFPVISKVGTVRPSSLLIHLIPTSAAAAEGGFALFPGRTALGAASVVGFKCPDEERGPIPYHQIPFEIPQDASVEKWRFEGSSFFRRLKGKMVVDVLLKIMGIRFCSHFRCQSALGGSACRFGESFWEFEARNHGQTKGLNKKLCLFLLFRVFPHWISYDPRRNMCLFFIPPGAIKNSQKLQIAVIRGRSSSREIWSERHHLHGGHQEWFRQFHSGERT